MEKLKIKNHFNYEVTKGLEPRGPVMVIENQVQTISEMLLRINGGLMPTFSNAEYPEDENDEQLILKDLTDLDKIKQKHDDLIVRLSNRKKEREAQKRKDEEERMRTTEPKPIDKKEETEPKNA